MSAGLTSEKLKRIFKNKSFIYGKNRNIAINKKIKKITSDISFVNGKKTGFNKKKNCFTKKLNINDFY